MSKIVVVFHSGYGHTKRVAESVAEGANASLLAIDAEGNLPENAWQEITEADAIIFGSPVYMGNVSWQFKKFADESSKAWFNRQWENKIFGGFVNSASMNGDKEGAIRSLQTLAAQHGGIWVSLSQLPSNAESAKREDVNYLGGSNGLLTQSPSDKDASAIPSGDLESAKRYGKRIADITARFK